MEETLKGTDKGFLLGDIQSRLEYWRRAVKLGGVVTVAMDRFEVQRFMSAAIEPGNHIAGRGHITAAMTVDELNAVAEHLDCVWAMNQAERLYYFIPKELLGAQR